MTPFHIDPDISRAATLPAEVYRDPRSLDLARERVFARSWQLVPGVERIAASADPARPGTLCPIKLLPGCLDEPLLLVRDSNAVVRALSNVCTHRGNCVVDESGPAAASLRCRYHGRRFGLDGRFLSMPGFEGAENFPSPADDLPKAPFGRWGPFAFAAVRPAFALEELLCEMRDRMGWLPLDRLAHDPALDRNYEVNANWILYCDNYLEGFHVPYVHAGLAPELDLGAYRTELFRWSNLQVGVGSGDEAVFNPPASSPDCGQRIAGYYFWLFPNTMFNFYPWGISINIVTPLAVDRTRVTYLGYVMDRTRLGKGAGGALDRVEREDEEIVERVQAGVRSRLYERGRYSPRHERGVHQFHRLLERFLVEESGASPCVVSSPR